MSSENLNPPDHINPQARPARPGIASAGRSIGSALVMCAGASMTVSGHVTASGWGGLFVAVGLGLFLFEFVTSRLDAQ